MGDKIYQCDSCGHIFEITEKKRCPECTSDKLNEGYADDELATEEEELLKEMKFEGSDVSLSISLLEYRTLWSPIKGGVVIYSRDESVTDRVPIYSFDWEYLSMKEITDAADEMPNGFYSFMGQSKESFIDQIQNQPAYAVESMNSYNGKLREMTDYYGLNYSRPELLKLLNIIKTEVIDVSYDEAKRNEPCPCGSGKKYKKCCGG